MYRALSLILTVILLISVSCQKDSDSIRRRDIIPDKDLVPILTDLYIADGLLSITPVKSRFAAKDSTMNYADVIKDHGYTKQEIDNTIHFYMVRNPKKLEKLYNRVIANLSGLEAQLEAEVPQIIPSATELWQGETTISVPETGLYNSVALDIPVRDTGLYVLSFDALVYKDDQSINPKVNIFFWRAGDTEEGIRDYWNKVELIRDGAVHSYSVEKRLTDPSYTHIKGWLLEHDPQPGRWQKHMRVTNIHLIKGEVL